MVLVQISHLLCKHWQITLLIKQRFLASPPRDAGVLGVSGIHGSMQSQNCRITADSTILLRLYYMNKHGDVPNGNFDPVNLRCASSEAAIKTSDEPVTERRRLAMCTNRHWPAIQYLSLLLFSKAQSTANRALNFAVHREAFLRAL